MPIFTATSARYTCDIIILICANVLVIVRQFFWILTTATKTLVLLTDMISTEQSLSLTPGLVMVEYRMFAWRVMWQKCIVLQPIGFLLLFMCSVDCTNFYLLRTDLSFNPFSNSAVFEHPMRSPTALITPALFRSVSKIAWRLYFLTWIFCQYKYLAQSESLNIAKIWPFRHV